MDAMVKQIQAYQTAQNLDRVVDFFQRGETEGGLNLLGSMVQRDEIPYDTANVTLETARSNKHIGDDIVDKFYETYANNISGEANENSML